MAEDRAQRHLAAILAADVVGYSRLMEQDEAGTFERLRVHRKDVFEPEIAKHQGRIFKLMGDGLLAEFGSVVDAVECAVAIQRAMAERNAGLTEGHRIDVRIGINLGDVIVENEDRHGDGVNIAARLQQLAEPGGIAVSRTVVDHVKHKLARAAVRLAWRPTSQEYHRAHRSLPSGRRRDSPETEHFSKNHATRHAACKIGAGNHSSSRCGCWRSILVLQFASSRTNPPPVHCGAAVHKSQQRS